MRSTYSAERRKRVSDVDAVRHEAALGRHVAEGINRGQPVACGELNHSYAVGYDEDVWRYHERAVGLARKRRHDLLHSDDRFDRKGSWVEAESRSGSLNRSQKKEPRATPTPGYRTPTRRTLPISPKLDHPSSLALKPSRPPAPAPPTPPPPRPGHQPPPPPTPVPHPPLPPPPLSRPLRIHRDLRRPRTPPRPPSGPGDDATRTPPTPNLPRLIRSPRRRGRGAWMGSRGQRHGPPSDLRQARNVWAVGSAVPQGLRRAGCGPSARL